MNLNPHRTRHDPHPETPLVPVLVADAVRRGVGVWRAVIGDVPGRFFLALAYGADRVDTPWRGIAADRLFIASVSAAAASGTCFLAAFVIAVTRRRDSAASKSPTPQA